MANVHDHPALPVLSIWKQRLGWGAYEKLRKTYPRDHDLSFANARKTVNFDIRYEDVYCLITIVYGDLRSNMGC